MEYYNERDGDIFLFSPLLCREKSFISFLVQAKRTGSFCSYANVKEYRMKLFVVSQFSKSLFQPASEDASRVKD